MVTRRLSPIHAVILAFLGLVLGAFLNRDAKAANRPTNGFNGTITLTTTAQQLTAGGTATVVCSGYLYNLNTRPIYVGFGNVSSSNGIPICDDDTVCPDKKFPFNAKGQSIWALRTDDGGGNITIRYMLGTGCDP